MQQFLADGDQWLVISYDVEWSPLEVCVESLDSADNSNISLSMLLYLHWQSVSDLELKGTGLPPCTSAAPNRFMDASTSRSTGSAAL